MNGAGRVTSGLRTLRRMTRSRNEYIMLRSERCIGRSQLGYKLFRADDSES